MNDDAFDREWSLAELLDANTLTRLGPALGQLLGGDVALLDAHDKVLWGVLAAQARRETLVLELEPIGYLASAQASPATLLGCRNLLVALLRAEIRFKMASTLHLEAIAADFETLKREHVRLLESEMRYRTLSEELEARVQAQVKQLEARQQQLYAVEKLASVGQLAAGMAHEINNPLGFVRSNLGTFEIYVGKLQQLKTRIGPLWQEFDLEFMLADSSDLLQDSIKGVDRIARIVSDLKSFSNVDRASEEMIDINECLQQVASVMELQLPPGITLQQELLPLPKVICLPGHLNQLFFNLLRNAIQAIEEAGRPGTVRIRSSADAHSISVLISDDGIGMNDTQLAHAFETFYTTRPPGCGAGLGLTTARNIAMAHGGQLALTSQPNLGTTATLFIPRLP